jgi:hypothetical protein
MSACNSTWARGAAGGFRPGPDGTVAARAGGRGWPAECARLGREGPGATPLAQPPQGRRTIVSWANRSSEAAVAAGTGLAFDTWVEECGATGTQGRVR